MNLTGESDDNNRRYYENNVAEPVLDQTLGTIAELHHFVRREIFSKLYRMDLL